MIGRSCRRRRFVAIAMLMACWSLTVKCSCLSPQSITKRTLYQTMQIPAAVPAQRRGEKENLQCAFRPENTGIYQQLTKRPDYKYRLFWNTGPERNCSGPGCFQGLTTFCGVPFKNARIFSAVISMIRWRLSFGAQEICGVRMQFFAVKSGLSGRIGSV